MIFMDKIKILPPLNNELITVQKLLSKYYFFYLKDLERTIDHILIAKDGEKIIGAIIYNKNFTKINMLSIDKSYQHQGIGTLLFNSSLNIFKEKMNNKITILSTKYPTNSVPFWIKQGFIEKEEYITKRGNKMSLMEKVLI